MANPPITIGELIDVPAPGSPIASAWPQEITHRSVHRFATSAARDAAWTNRGAGALAWTADYGRLCMWDGGGWLILRESATTVAAGSGNNAVWPHSTGASSTIIGQTATWAVATTVQAQYIRYAGLCHIVVQFKLGASGFGIGQLNLPFVAGSMQPIDQELTVTHIQASSGVYWAGWSQALSNQRIALMSQFVSGTSVSRQSTSATVPFTWTTGDMVGIVGTYTLSNPYDQFYMNP